jgi:hypothetical protein
VVALGRRTTGCDATHDTGRGRDGAVVVVEDDVFGPGTNFAVWSSSPPVDNDTPSPEPRRPIRAVDAHVRQMPQSASFTGRLHIVPDDVMPSRAEVVGASQDRAPPRSTAHRATDDHEDVHALIGSGAQQPRRRTNGRQGTPCTSGHEVGQLTEQAGRASSARGMLRRRRASATVSRMVDGRHAERRRGGHVPREEIDEEHCRQTTAFGMPVVPPV